MVPEVCVRTFLIVPPDLDGSTRGLGSGSFSVGNFCGCFLCGDGAFIGFQ